jgi:Rod binding domain-containing protein
MDLPPIAPRPLAATADRLGLGAKPDASAAERAARATAEAYEATFLAEMLKHSGANALPEGFGGGAGEEAFAGFLTQEQARLMAARGGIGLAEIIFNQIVKKGPGA